MATPMVLDILGGTEVQKYKNLNSQRTVNWYLVMSTLSEASKSQKSMFPTPGLTEFCDASANGRYWRGAFIAQTLGSKDRCFAVLDTTLYEILNNTTFINRGSLSQMATGWTRVKWAVNGNNQMYVGHETAGYNYDLVLNVLTQITDPVYPNVVSADYMDGSLIVADTKGEVRFNDVLNDFTNWTGLNGTGALDVFIPSFKNDGAEAVFCLKEEIHVFGSSIITTYLNDGVSPFSRRYGSTVKYGLAARDSAVVWNDGIIFLGRNEDGQYAVYTRGYDYSINQISDFSKNWLLNDTLDTVKHAYAYITYTKDGHIWYHLTIPGLKTTLVYDIMTKEWFERQSKQPYRDSDGMDVYREFRGKYHVNFLGHNLFFDQYSGKVFEEDYNNQTEDGNTILRNRTSKIFEQSRLLISTSEFELDYNAGESATSSGQGSDPIIMLEISRDGGRTFGNPRNIRLGALGKFINRAKLNRLGIARAWCLRLTLTDPVDVMIQSCIASGTINGPTNRENIKDMYGNR